MEGTAAGDAVGRIHLHPVVAVRALLAQGGVALGAGALQPLDLGLTARAVPPDIPGHARRPGVVPLLSPHGDRAH